MNQTHNPTQRHATVRARFAPLAALAAAALLPGCGTNAHHIDSTGNETIVSLDRVDIQDFAIAADSLLQSLYDSPAFKVASKNGTVIPVIAFSQVLNDTTSQFDTDLLVNKISGSITRSGKAEISAVVGSTQDSLTKDANRANARSNGGGKAPDNTPDLVLVGKILQTNAKAGNTRQVSYTFQLSLNNTARGTKLWVDEKTITKQGTRASVGW
ncbi:MAG: penicillin-binding protein activator LpoB [Puniceicoccales bacterium]|jgi:uncharacterized protein (TIGR02722 family)|nr:penicillin-binding protein activator LpoB [Puniceicoccales bacterium]